MTGWLVLLVLAVVNAAAALRAHANVRRRRRVRATLRRIRRYHA